MSKREKILLELLIVIGVLGVTIIYLFLPTVKEKNELIRKLNSSQMKVEKIENVLKTSGLDEALESHKAVADENYKYFYSELNTYTIDRIVNNLVTKSNLNVLGMSIGSYNSVKIDNLKRGDDSLEEQETEKSNSEESDFLLGCNVNLNVKGSYKKILDFADIIKEESTCIEITSLVLHRNERDVEGKEPIEASFSLLIYGVNETGEEDA